MDTNKVDLNAPAFGDKAQKVVDIEKPVVVDTIKEPEALEEEEGKVRYSRFKSVNERRLQAEQLAEQYRQEAEELRSQRTVKPEESDDVPSYFLKMYGDRPETHEAWKLQKAHDEEVLERAELRAREALRSERTYESSRTNENVEVIDNNLDNLSDFVGRDLTVKEQSRILDIVDDYTPKDDDGNYQGPPIPFEKAWRIYELENQNANGSRIRSRTQVADQSGTRTEGEVAINEEQNKAFNPSWGSLDRAIKERLG